MRERQSQLRQYVVDMLCRMDPTLPRPQDRKRPQAMANLCSVMRLGKKRKVNTDGDDKTQAPKEIQPPMQTEDSLQVNAGTALPTPVPSTWFDASDTDCAIDSTSLLSNCTVDVPTCLSARKVAPMFRSVTITPSYYTEQNVSRLPPAPLITEADGDCSVVNPFSGDASANYSTPQLEQYLPGTLAEDYSDDLFYMARVSGSPAVRMVAPMFRNVTITPTYNTEQESQFGQTPPHPMVPTVTELLRMPHSGAVACQDGTIQAAGAAQAQEAQFY
jgi:hypothetical protein